MTTAIIQSMPDFLNLKTDWNSLLSQSASRVPFLRHEYLSSWWETLGGGEWSRGELAILLRKNEENVLDGIAPFFITDHQVMFLGSFEISDYLDLISAPENLDTFIKQITLELSSPDFPDWKNLVLYNLLENSPTIPLLVKAASAAGWRTQQEILQPAPYIPLPPTWDDYLAGLGDRYRHEIERKLRNAETYFLPVDWYMVTDEQALDIEMDQFLGLMANNPDKAAFLTPEMVIQMKTSARQAFREGWLQLAFLVIGDIKAAGYLNFDFDGKIWIYNSGINSMFENISPGWVLLSKIIQWSIEQGKSEVDLMRGSEAYKYNFGGIDRQVLRLEISK